MKNILLLLLLCFLSCNKQEINIIELPEETQIKGLDYSTEMIMNYPLSIDFIDGKLLLVLFDSEHVMKIIDANTGDEISQTGTIGNGPGEFLQPRYFGFNKNKDLYFYDLRQKKLRTYNWSDILNAPELPKTDGISLKNTDLVLDQGTLLNNKHFVSTTIVGFPKPITLLDNDLNVIDNTGSVPDKEHQSIALTSYMGHVSSYENKFVFVIASLGYVACYEQLQDGKSKLLWDRFTEAPIYKDLQLNMKELKLGFTNVKMTKHYIFCSYFGQKYNSKNRKKIKPRNILVFDHQGNFLKNLHSDRSVGKIAISDDEKTLYAVTEEPQVAIIRFDISDLTK